MSTPKEIILTQNILQMQQGQGLQGQGQQGQQGQQVSSEGLMRSAGDIISKAREDFNQICPRKVVIGLCLLQLVTCLLYVHVFSFHQIRNGNIITPLLNLGLSLVPEFSAVLGLYSLYLPNRRRILLFYYAAIISVFCCVGFLIGNLMVFLSEDSTTNDYIFCGIQMPFALLLLHSTLIFVKIYHQPITSIPQEMFVMDFTSQRDGIQQPVQNQESAQTQGVEKPLMPEA